MNRALVLSSFLVNFFLLHLFLSFAFFLGFLVLQHFTSNRRSRLRRDLLFYSLALPPALAWVVLGASLIPPFFTLEDHLCNPHFHISHPYHHLCFFESPISLPSSLLFRGLLIVSLSLILFALIRGLHLCWQRRVLLQWLTRRSAIPQDWEDLTPQARSLLQEFREREGARIYLLRSHLPVSFLCGLFTPQIILSTGLLRLLSFRQIRALLQHEMAHHMRRDNLTQLFLSFCRDLLFLSPTGHFLLRKWRQEAELWCDEFAIYRTRRPLDLAEALLKVQKALAIENPFGSGNRLCSAFLQPLGTPFLERRIRHILTFCDRDLARPHGISASVSPLVGLVGFTTCSFFLLSLSEIWLCPLLLHCQLERIIRFLV
ncbi:MAG: M56 family metallopeptidase [candidate division NC10 bacterium]|nr:M56 family metallopeptidase [candidate division NC10 bacterium]